MSQLCDAHYSAFSWSIINFTKNWTPLTNKEACVSFICRFVNFTMGHTFALNGELENCDTDPRIKPSPTALTNREKPVIRRTTV